MYYLVCRCKPEKRLAARCRCGKWFTTRVVFWILYVGFNLKKIANTVFGGLVPLFSMSGLTFKKSVTWLLPKLHQNVFIEVAAAENLH